MAAGNRRGILVVSFGTSHNDTCKKTIEQIENDIREQYPNLPLYRAWTSGMIRKKVEKRDGIHIFGVKEALEVMAGDGIRELVVQPTHVLNGIENTHMEQEIKKAEGMFEKIAVGAPLLTTQEDSEKMVRLLTEEWKLSDEEALVYMGHGTEHHSNFAYAALNYQFKRTGNANMIMGTVEAYPAIEHILEEVKERHVRKVILAPFMIVAGDHANHDLAGEDEDSWKTVFEREGYEVQCVLKGLGEYKEVRKMFLEHLEKTMAVMDDAAQSA